MRWSGPSWSKPPNSEHLVCMGRGNRPRSYDRNAQKATEARCRCRADLGVRSALNLRSFTAMGPSEAAVQARYGERTEQSLAAGRVCSL